MKKLLKRLLPVAMALSMMFSMSATALAADDLLPQDAAIPEDALVLTEDTVITEDGGNLSQGQKQLLCIARVMLALPPMLILDEATSSIDTRTEQKVQRAFARMMEGRTSFIVAHRLSTIQNADRILVMKDGHIMEQGTHRELLEKQGFYAHLYNSGLAPAGMPGPGAG